MPSEHYIENWQRTNEWLNKNAPGYVVKCIEELANLAAKMNEELLFVNKSVIKISTSISRQGTIIQELKQDLRSLRAEDEYRRGLLEDKKE